jgi:hypothetical protein
MISRRLHTGALLLSLSLNSANAFGDSSANAVGTNSLAVQRCVELHEQARIQRVQEQWLLARQSMTQCAADSCPLALRVDCQDWLAELSNVLPTLLIVIEREDGDATPVELELDGKRLELPEPLGPLELLPGKHRLRAQSGTQPPLELEFSLEKGEKNRVVPVRFARKEAPPQPPQVPRTEPQATPAPRQLSEARRPVPAATYWLSGGALVAFATSGVLLGSALSSLSSARDSCAPGCDASVRRSIDGRLLAADVFGGVGIALTGIALYTFVSRPTEPKTVTSELAIVPGGALLSFGRRF